MSLADQGPPRLVDGLDVRSLPLSPEDAFVLSRVDGSAAPSEIAASTGLPEERVVQCLQRLRELGAIRDGSAARVPTVQAAEDSERPRRTNSSVRLRPAVETPTHSVSLHPAARAYDPELLNEPADIDEDRKKLILDHFHALDRFTHYSILRVAEHATKAEIKEAYYDRVGLFHPDRYFGKELGSFKPKLEKVFGALTKAYDTLTRRRSREEYDRYLAARRRTAGLGGSAPPVRVTPVPAGGAQASLTPPPGEVPGATSSSGASAPPRRAPTPPPASAPPPASTPSARPAPPPRTASMPPADPEAMRRALARKLRGSRPSIPAPPRAPTIDPAVSARAASEDLRARYAKHLGDTADGQVKRYRKLAEEAIEAQQFPSAINALKVALSVAPEDPELSNLLEQTQEQADTAHADQFLEQARYEEKDGRLLKAARSYERAARGKKSAALYDRAAMCLIQADTEGRKAVELARKAVELDGVRGQYRLTLARAYHLAHLPASASVEIKRAQELAPENEEIKTWSKRLR